MYVVVLHDALIYNRDIIHLYNTPYACEGCIRGIRRTIGVFKLQSIGVLRSSVPQAASCRDVHGLQCKRRYTDFLEVRGRRGAGRGRRGARRYVRGTVAEVAGARAPSVVGRNLFLFFLGVTDIRPQVLLPH
jgi:hypothetical protein